MKKKTTILLLLTALLLSCSTRPGKTDERIITVTIEPVRYFTEQIAGDKFKVVSMVPEGLSPETYDPTPQQLVQLAQSQAYLRIGYIGFEQTWMHRLEENAPQMQVFDLSQGVTLIREEHPHSHEAHTEHHHGHVHTGGVEPHIWNSPSNARIIVQNIYQALCRLDADNQAYYAARLEQAYRLIDATDREIRTLLEKPHDHAFLIYHPALSYYAREYGLHQVCIEDNGKEPSATHLKALLDECRSEGIRVVFIQKEFDTRNASLIAHEIGGELITINPLNFDWKAELIYTTKALCHE